VQYNRSVSGTGSSTPQSSNIPSGSFSVEDGNAAIKAQENHIKKNLDELVRLTTVNTTVVSMLIAKGILSSEDSETLVRTHSNI